MVIVTQAISSAKIPSVVDATLDRQMPNNSKTMPGISISHGDVKVEDSSTSNKAGLTNGAAAAAKRKVRESLTRPVYADSESSDDDLPLVCNLLRPGKQSTQDGMD